MRQLVAIMLVAACGPTAGATGTKALPTSATRATRDGEPVVSGSPSTSRPSGTTPSVAATITSLDDIWKRVGSDFTACYETGRKTVPEMVDGHIALVTAVDPSGKTACVVPTDDSGLTSDVEDCMRVRLERESYGATGAPWSTRVPVQVKSGKVGLGGPNPSMTIDEIDSRGLSEDLYDVVDGLLPDVKECVRGGTKAGGRRVVVVGARIAQDGAVACAVASSQTPVPDQTQTCLATVFSRARFKAPKKGFGLLSIPIEIR